MDVALSSGGNFEKFWKIFDERLALCHKALQARHQRLMGTPSDAAPILWQYGALARLKKGEKIDKLLFGGYSTISLGYAGLYECVKYMTCLLYTSYTLAEWIAPLTHRAYQPRSLQAVSYTHLCVLLPAQPFPTRLSLLS